MIRRLPLRGLALLILGALGLAACDADLFGPSSSSGGAPPPCVNGPTCCGLATLPETGTDAGAIPSRPNGAPPPSGGKVVLAVSQIFFGDTDRQGAPSETAWQRYGLNIDGKTTGLGSTDTCTPVTGAQCNALLDGDNGIDNAFGETVMPILTTLDSTFSQTANAAIQQGAPTLLVELDGTGSGASYTSMTGALYRAAPASAVQWNGDDVRNVDPLSLVGGSIAQPTTVFPDGYMNGRSWVGMAPAGSAWLDLHIPVGGSELPPVPIEHVQIVMQVAADGSSATGTLAGVIRTSDAVAWTQQWASAGVQNNCDGGYSAALVQQVEQASDIMADGTNEPGHTCDGISIGLGFDAVAVKLGQPQSVPGFVSPCSDAGRSASPNDAGAGEESDR